MVPLYSRLSNGFVRSAAWNWRRIKKLINSLEATFRGRYFWLTNIYCKCIIYTIYSETMKTVNTSIISGMFIVLGKKTNQM